MKLWNFVSTCALVAATAFALCAAGPALAQKSGASDKRAACIAKARAENPDRAAGSARQAAFNRCMRGG